ncbi:hypothetical protein F0L68_06950 [Solihabitans fulvus]|uniref:DUF3592 domain-containing protein n=1 Tax=Solihabitans fulvus TaxID=1892852 RepID=A0A5B2XPJ0_9PSEU|nr:DUF3592 domain-containing protein [Solihabitans fulvus]KAA2264811.1 hypothetical protein F0L68_06950 [Solihabitans fulvus]
MVGLVLGIVGCVVTALALLLLVACWRDDSAIESHLGKATAQVISVGLNRTLVRYETPDGAVHIPNVGVMYPAGLHEGDHVSVEYDSTLPDERVRVAGRTVSLAFLPVGTAVLGLWIVLAPLVWWLRRPAPLWPVRRQM